MKNTNKRVLSISFLCVLVMVAMIFTGCSTKDIEAKIDANAVAAENTAKELEGKIDETASKAAENLAAAKTALEGLISQGDAANTEALTAAITKVTEAIEETKTAMGTADGALKTELDAAIASAVETLNTAITNLSNDLNGKITALDTAIKSNDGEITALQTTTNKTATDVATIQGTIATINTTLTALGESDTKTATKLQTLKESLEALQEDVQEATETIAASYVKINDWDAATEVVIENLVYLEEAYGLVRNAGYYDSLTNDTQGKLADVYFESYVKLLRAISIDQAEEILTYAESVYEGIADFADIRDEYVQDDYYDEEWAQINEIVADAVDAFNALEQDSEIAADDIVTFMEESLENVLTKEEVDAAKAINDRVAALDEALDAEANDNPDDFGYNATTKAEYEDLMETIDAWNELVGEDAKRDRIDDAAIEALIAEYEAIAKAYADAADALLAKLAPYIAEDYVFVYANDYDDVLDLCEEAMLWAVEVQWGRQFSFDGADETDVYAAIEAFNEGAYSRALALHTAKAEAAAINEAVTALTADIEGMTMIKSEYQIRYSAIRTNVETWIETYFEAPYDNVESEAEAQNYAMLNHEAYAALVTLYDTEIRPVIESAKNVAEAITAVGAVEDVTISSWEAILAAQNAYAEFTNQLADLSYDLRDVEGVGEYGKPGVMTEKLAELLAAYNECLAGAEAAYDLLTVLTKADVTVYTKDEVQALVDWYETYLGLDITAETPVYPEGKVYEISDALEITVDNFNAACEAYNAYNELIDAQAALLEQIALDTKAILDVPAYIAQREAIEAVFELMEGWETGDSTFKPEGFEDEQFASYPDLIEDMKADLTARSAEVKALEDRLAALSDRIDALVQDYEDLATVDARNEATDEINSIKNDMETLIADNDDKECFTEEQYATIVSAELALEKANRIADVTGRYEEVVSKINTITDDYVKQSLMADAAESLAEAKEAIAAIESVDAESDITLAEAEFALVEHIVEVYTTNPSGFSPEIMKARYQILETRAPMSSADQLEIEKTFVTETFTKITV